MTRNIESWVCLEDGLYKVSWKSSTLECRIFAHSPSLLDSLSFQELERFAAFLDALSHRSYDLSYECLVLGEEIFPLVGDDKDAFLSLASTLVETGWREVKSFFEAGAKALPRIDSDQRLRFMELAENLVRNGGTNIPGTMSVHATELYAKNVNALLTHIHNKEELTLNMEDEITEGSLYLYNGEITDDRTKEALS